MVESRLSHRFEFVTGSPLRDNSRSGDFGPGTASGTRRSGFLIRSLRWSSWQERWVAKAGIALVRGHGRICAAKEVTVTAEDGTVTALTARHGMPLPVATGSDPFVPEIDGLTAAQPWTAREATTVKYIPSETGNHRRRRRHRDGDRIRRPGRQRNHLNAVVSKTCPF